jgi:hypothetical protein
MRDFSGEWATTFGPMRLERDGERITGTYGRTEVRNTLSGRLVGSRLEFEYSEPTEAGTGWFDLVREGHFVGEYTPAGAAGPQPWSGNRGFDGIWNTSFGMVRLVESGGRVRGLLAAGGTIDGAIENGRLQFHDIVPGPKGSGELTLGTEGYQIAGRWQAEGDVPAIEIGGVRVTAQPRLTWLIVLEAHWQRLLAEREFAFGHMLGEIFARYPHVEVRHRYFHDETSLLHWCRAVQMLAEPVVVVITSHGEAEGLHVMGGIIDSRRIIDTLELADSLRLVHFSSCLVANGGENALANPCFPVSGYTNSVDWMASALTEFTYLDMILGKGLSPTRAAEQVYKLIGFSGDTVAQDCPYPAAGFQLVPRKRTHAMGGGGGTMVADASAQAGWGLLGRLGDLRDKLTGRG